MATGTAMSDTMEKDLLERWLKNTTTNMGAVPANVYVGLGTAVSGEASNALTEPSTTRGYTRQAITFGATAVGSGTPPSATTGIQITGPSGSAVTFGPNTVSDWGSITHFGVYNNQTVGSGELMFWGALGSSVSIQVNDSFQFATGSITITAD